MMKSFRMMSLPLLVGTLLLFCGAPNAGATTFAMTVIKENSLTNGHRIIEAEFVDSKLFFADEAKLQTFFYHRTGALKPHKSQFVLAKRGRTNRIWILTFLDWPIDDVRGAADNVTSVAADEVTGVSNISTSFPLSVSLVPSTAVTTTATSVPEAPSLHYLALGLFLCGGFWVRSRRLSYRTGRRSPAD